MSEDVDPEEEIVRRELDPAEQEPNYGILSVIADVEGVDPVDLPSMYDRTDHLLDELYSQPPVPEAQVEVTFSYHGYRVTADQEGTVTLRKLETDAEVL